MSNSWSLYVIVLTAITLIGTVWVLFANRTSSTGTEQTTGHSADGIEEYDNPLPAWWFGMFVITIVFAIGYLIVFPGMGNYPGLLDWTSEQKWQKENAAANEKFAKVFEQYQDVPVVELHTHKKAMKMAQRIFSNNCAQCHGVDARGTTGIPNLTDNDWQWGGSPEQIVASITNGRVGIMASWSAALGGHEGVNNVARYVMTLANPEAFDANDTGLSKGKQSYQTLCVACHGVEGKGNILLGAPDLTDPVWLYGGSLVEIEATIRHGRNGVMPAHRDTLNAAKIHLLSGYVYGLSR